MSHSRRLVLLHELRKLPITISNIIYYKPKLSPAVFSKQGQRLYFYAVRYLRERVSWFCRDEPHTGDGSARVVFSNRSNLSYPELRSHLIWLEESEQ